MSVNAKMAEAFTIFDKYPDDNYVAAEHDILYAGPEPGTVSAEDVARLEELGWGVDSEFNCFRAFV